MSKIHIVEFEEVFDFEITRSLWAFSSYEKAKIKFNKLVSEIKKDLEFNTVTVEEDNYIGYDKGWYDQQHINICINTLEIDAEE